MLTIATCSPDLRPRDLGADDLHHPLLLGLRGAAGQAPGGAGPARIRQAAGETHLLPGQIQDNLLAREPPLCATASNIMECHEIDDRVQNRIYNLLSLAGASRVRRGQPGVPAGRGAGRGDQRQGDGRHQEEQSHQHQVRSSSLS